MGKLLMLAGGIVEPGKGEEATVSAYVALSAGRQSRGQGQNRHALAQQSPIFIGTHVTSPRYQVEPMKAHRRGTYR